MASKRTEDTHGATPKPLSSGGGIGRNPLQTGGAKSSFA